MKFKDIKRGDTVYWLQKVTTSNHISKWFWLPAKVVKVTPKRFWVEFRDGDRYLGPGNYRKKDGRFVGEFFIQGQQYVYSQGDVANDDYFEGGVGATDESHKIEPFKQKWEGLQGQRVISLRRLAAALLKLDIAELYDKPEGELSLLGKRMNQLIGPEEKESDE